MARLIGEGCQRRDDVAIVARSLPNALANNDRDGTPHIDCGKVMPPGGQVEGIVSHSNSDSYIGVLLVRADHGGVLKVQTRPD